MQPRANGRVLQVQNRNLSCNTKSVSITTVEFRNLNLKVALKALHIGEIGHFTLSCAYLGPLVGYSLATLPFEGSQKDLEGLNCTETRPVSGADHHRCVVLSCLVFLLVAPTWLPSSKSRTWACCLVVSFWHTLHLFLVWRFYVHQSYTQGQEQFSKGNYSLRAQSNS